MILSSMFLDITPSGGRRQSASRKQIQNIKKGGEIADEIREMSDHHHENHEIPKAEAHLEDAFENWPEKKQEGNLPPDKARGIAKQGRAAWAGGMRGVKPSIWIKIKSFFKV